MTMGRRLWVACSLACAAAGCAGSGSGSLLSPPASVGSLKTSLSHMEYENRQLKNSIAKLESENREIENRLVQEESANGELSARLDDARHLLSQHGGEGSDALDGGVNNPRRTLPAGQSNRKKRKPPFAQIPGRIDSISGDDPADEPEGAPRSDLGPQGRLDRSSQWFPVANGTSDAPLPRR